MASFRPGLKGSKSDLSQNARQNIKELSRSLWTRYVFEIFKVWAEIIGIIVVAEYAGSLLIKILAIFLIATRQNVLGLLMHEQSHYLGLKQKYGDLLTNFCVCYPLMLVTVESYAAIHLNHHRYYLTDKDPDLQRKSGKDWLFPMEHKQLLKLFVCDLIGLNILATTRGKNNLKGLHIRRLWKIPWYVRPVYFIFALLLITILNGWHIFFIYWLLPLVTFLQVIIRWGAIREHDYILNGSVIETTPIIINPLWEELLMPSKNFLMHPYHHYFPNVPFYNLPKIHEIFEREGLVEKGNIYYGSLDYLKAIIKKDKLIK